MVKTPFKGFYCNKQNKEVLQVFGQLPLKDSKKTWSKLLRAFKYSVYYSTDPFLPLDCLEKLSCIGLRGNFGVLEPTVDNCILYFTMILTCFLDLFQT